MKRFLAIAVMMTSVASCPAQFIGRGSVTTSAQVQATLAQLLPGASAVFLPGAQGACSGVTTLTDYSGNGFNGTFGTSTQAPTWTANCTGIQFFGHQNISIPSGVMLNAGTIELIFALTTPMETDGAQSNEMMLCDGVNRCLSTVGAYNGQMIIGVGGNLNTRGTDRYVGVASVTYTVPSAGTGIVQYIDGRQVSGYSVPGATGSAVLFNSANPGMFGDLPIIANSGWGGQYTLYAAVIYPNTVTITPAQIAQNDVALKTALYNATGVRPANFTPENMCIVNGDSRYVNVGASWALASSIPYQIFKKLGICGSSYTNVAISGNLATTMNTNIGTTEYPLLDGFSNGVKLSWTDACTNDISAGATAAACYTQIQNYCSNHHTRYPGIAVVAATLSPRSNESTAAEAVRETFNSTMIAAAIAGTFNCDAVVDEAGSPVGETQTVPNSFKPTGSASFNATYYFDGLHYTAALDTILANVDQLGVMAALGRLNRPVCVQIPVPFVVLNTFTGTSQVLPLLQLFPGWKVSSITETVTTAFVGTGVVTLADTIGDSGGTATQYLTSTSLLSTGSTVNGSPNYQSASGIVQGTFTSAGGNLSALTAGNVNYEVCVQTTP